MLVPLDGLLRDTNKLLLECARTVGSIEVEKPFRLVHVEERWRRPDSLVM